VLRAWFVRGCVILVFDVDWIGLDFLGPEGEMVYLVISSGRVIADT
jgi:hypothetical protein